MSEFTFATRAEADMMAKSVPDPVMEKRIKKDFYIETVVENSTPLVTDKYCASVNKSVTWDTPMPKGFFDERLKWHSLLCRYKLVSTDQTKKCLRNTNVMIFGDSNAKYMDDSVWHYLGWPKHSCTFSKDGEKHLKAIRNFRRTCHSDQLNFTLSLFPQEYHLFLEVRRMIFTHKQNLQTCKD